MDFIQVGIISFILLFILLFLGVSIAADFFLVGFLGLLAILGFDRAVSILGQTLYFVVAKPSWGSLPLFILMGAIAGLGGFAGKAYKGLNKVTIGIPGALGVTTCYACAFFGAISGSAIATAAVFAKLAYPEMRKYGYDKSFAVGIIASAGTFATMIPPSGLMVFYCLLTELSIGKLFAAGIIPGFLTATVYSFSIIYRSKYNPKLVKNPDNEAINRITPKDRMSGLIDLWPMILISLTVLGGLYGGLFSPVEAAAAGCTVTLLLGILLRQFKDKKSLLDSLKQSASTTSMMLVIIIGSLFFSRFFAFTRVPTALTTWLLEINIPNIMVLFGVLMVWFLLGMVLVPVSIYALTMPIIFPILMQFGYDPIWFGIITIKMCEIAAVTPPVGLNLFTIKSCIGKDVKTTEIYNGIWPFVLCDIIVLILMIIFPEIVLWLPNLLFS